MVGFLSSVGTFSLGFFETTKPYLQYFGLIVGLCIGVLTVRIKFLELKKLKQKSEK